MKSSAVVIGGSMAGLLAARVLSDQVGRVTILERDDLIDAPQPRSGVPQGRNAHALLAAGAAALDRLLPGVIDDLVAAGGVRVNMASNNIWHHGGAPRVRYRSRITAYGFTRPLLETLVRRRVTALANVSVRAGVAVRGLTGDGERVTGVRFQHGRETGTMTADLVVDCTGRAGRSLPWLTDLGHRLPEVSEVRVDIGFATTIVDRRPGDLAGADYLWVLQPLPGARSAVVLPIEGDRWIVHFAGAHGDHPPADSAGLLDFARTLPTSEVAPLVERSQQRAATFRMPSNQWRHVERLRRPTAGHLLLGDAICSFNPVYGQGMTSAALQAEALSVALGRYGLGGDRLARAFYRGAARVVAGPWTIAASSDFTLPRTTGPKPPGTDTVNRYLAQVLRACHSSQEIAEQMYRVQNLLSPPTSLMRPDRIVRTLLAARRSPVRGGAVRPAELAAGAP